MCDNGEFDLAERVLCSDDTCIGLVGPDGKCKVCGTPYTGEEPVPSPTSGVVSTEDSISEETQDREDVSSVTDTDDTDVEDIDTEETDTDDRICCPDDTCIGIIGEDGRCGTCGKEA